MSESITQRLSKISDKNDAKELRAVLEAVLTDLTAVNTQLGQLITDYNANATIATDTTAVAPTLTLTD
jgi:hypothetical protein